jgi:Helicase conserved C-terminal domain
MDLTVEFLSGEAPKDQISRIVQQALSGGIDVLLANLVISLGVDIHDLNNMVMLGVPRSFTEYVQTAGRTGRGATPGHVHVVLQPFYPRDAYMYRHFHAILSDVAGYYDVLPVRSTNLFCASEMFGNVAKALLSALCMNPKAPQWTNSRGIRNIMASMDGRIQAAITSILCDDPTLTNEIRSMVDVRLSRLLEDLYRSNEFLSTAIRDSDTPWLIYSLRGKTGASVNVRCMDQLLAERLAATASSEVASQEEIITDAE